VTTLAEAAPVLHFSAGDAAVYRGAAVPTLRLPLHASAPGATVRGLALSIDVRIAAQRRRYRPSECERLAEIFGTPEQWARSIGSVPWTRATVNVPAFEGARDVDVLLPCSYDFEVAAAKYLAALDDGDIPVDVVITGNAYFADAGGRLQIAKLPWDADVPARIPVALWREAVDAVFAGTGWVRLDRALLQRLQGYRSRHGHGDWDATLASLLDGAGA